MYPYRYALSPAFAAHTLKAVFQQHHRERLPALRRVVPKSGVIFDLGGHAGQYTKLLAGLAPQGRVYAFEPSSYALSILRLTVSAHRLGNVTIIPQGVGSSEGLATLRIPIKGQRMLGFGLAHLGPDSSGRGIYEETIIVTTLDAFATRSSLKRLDFIKADIEGWELRMLEGAALVLARFRPALLIELVDSHLRRAGDDIRAAWAFLGRLGYRAFTQEGDGEFEPLPGPVEGDIWWLPA